MTAPAARFKSDLRWSDTLPDNFESSIDAACAKYVSELRQVAGRGDGSWSEVVKAWTVEFERLASKDESEVAA